MILPSRISLWTHPPGVISGKKYFVLCFSVLYKLFTFNWSVFQRWNCFWSNERYCNALSGCASFTSAIYKIILSFGSLRACLHGGGGPQVGEVAPLGGVTRLSIQSLIRSPQLSCKHDQIKMRDYLDKWVTSPTWGPLPPCRQALNEAVNAAFIWLRAQTPITAQL